MQVPLIRLQCGKYKTQYSFESGSNAFQAVIAMTGVCQDLTLASNAVAC